jgi:hypothetical protein
MFARQISSGTSGAKHRVVQVARELPAPVEAETAPKALPPQPTYADERRALASIGKSTPRLTSVPPQDSPLSLMLGTLRDQRRERRNAVLFDSIPPRPRGVDET